MEKFVTQEECQDRRREILNANAKQTEDISKMNGEIKALTVEIKHLVNSNKWFMGIISSILGGLMVWLITK